MTPLTYLKQRVGDDWLIGSDSQEFFAFASQVLQELEQRSPSQPSPTILLAERQPLKFLAYFIAACAANCPIALANPDWGKTEWQQVFQIVQPDLVWGEVGKGVQGTGYGVQGIRYRVQGKENKELKTQNFLAFAERVQRTQRRKALLKTSPTFSPILIPTGGTSGTIRFAIHTWETLMASVEGFQKYFGVNQVNSFCVLPLYHVSGLMQFLRSFTSGGKLAIFPFKAIETGNVRGMDPTDFFLSLVPTQLQRLLPTSPTLPWLARFPTILLGGAPAWPELLETARQQQLRLAPTYGMTETASQIVTLKPDDFLQGKAGCGQVLPHAQLTIRDPDGNVLGPNQVGVVSIESKSLCLGYCSIESDLQDQGIAVQELPLPLATHPPQSRQFQPDDLGFLDDQGYLHIVGRSSDKIITGGENVFPAEVEAAIRATGMVGDVCVLGVNDCYWGEAITAIYTPVKPNISLEILKSAVAARLSRFKCPKHWVAVEQLPRNAQGKLDRRQVKAMIRQVVGSR